MTSYQELYNTSINGTIVGVITYIDQSTNYMFLPITLLVMWVLLLFLNRQNFKFGLMSSSFIIFVVAILFRILFPYFPDLYVFVPLVGVLLGVIVTLFF